MSTAVRTRPTVHPSVSRPFSTQHETRRLRLVVPPIARKGVPFSTLCIGLLVLGVLSVLLANIYISRSTYHVDNLTAHNDELHAERDRLAEDISYRQSPQNIKAEAQKLGMSYDSNPSFLMPDGEIVKTEWSVSEKNDTEIPAPRADAREDLRPNLRSEDVLPAVGTDSGSDLESPKVATPK